MNVVTLDPQLHIQKKRVESLLSVVDDLRKKIEEGHVTEFVVSALDEDNNVEIYAHTKDFLGGLGMFEMGKNIFIKQMDQ
jgi:hypothetical protein